MYDFCLLALVPPGNVRAVVEVARGSLLRRGTFSVRALPPLVPLAASRSMPEDAAVTDAVQRYATGFRTTGWVVGNGSLYLGIEPALRAFPADAPRAAGPAPAEELPRAFSEVPGIWVAADAAVPPEPFPQVSWGVSTVAVFRLRVHAKPWWQNLFWETVRELRTARQRS